MYWRSSQYEPLRNRERSERSRILRSAIARYGQAYRTRFRLALLVLVGLVVLENYFHQDGSLSSSQVWAVAVGAATLFYAYLLWEINGTIRAAVERYVAAEEAAKPIPPV
jgi:hypothetical protein